MMFETISVWCCWFVEWRSLVCVECGYFRRSLYGDTYLQRYFTHGNTYAEAIANAEEVLELLIEDYEATIMPMS
jgi:hypothetical protein